MIMTAATAFCDDRPHQDQALAPNTKDCTTACAALPAPAAPTLSSVTARTTSLTIGVAAPFTSIEPEIATPLPKGV